MSFFLFFFSYIILIFSFLIIFFFVFDFFFHTACHGKQNGGQTTVYETPSHHHYTKETLKKRTLTSRIANNTLGFPYFFFLFISFLSSFSFSNPLTCCLNSLLSQLSIIFFFLPFIFSSLVFPSRFHLYISFSTLHLFSFFIPQPSHRFSDSFFLFLSFSLFYIVLFLLIIYLFIFAPSVFYSFFSVI